MGNLVSLRNVIEEMQLGTDGLHTYLNKVTGEITTITDEHLDAVESGFDLNDYSDWEQEALEEAKEIHSSCDYLEFPSQFDIHEYEIIQNFCLSVENNHTREALLNQIRGSGAFRRFKNALMGYGIEQDWYTFKNQAYKAISIEWLESNNIEYVDDMKDDHTG